MHRLAPRASVPNCGCGRRRRACALEQRLLSRRGGSIVEDAPLRSGIVGGHGQSAMMTRAPPAGLCARASTVPWKRWGWKKLSSGRGRIAVPHLFDAKPPQRSVTRNPTWRNTPNRRGNACYDAPWLRSRDRYKSLTPAPPANLSPRCINAPATSATPTTTAAATMRWVE